MQFAIRVKPDYQFNSARVGGQNFVKSQAVLLNESELTDEIRKSPLLIVEPYKEPAPLQPNAASIPNNKANNKVDNKVDNEADDEADDENAAERARAKSGRKKPEHTG